jgi:hypothetical protein
VHAGGMTRQLGQLPQAVKRSLPEDVLCLSSASRQSLPDT